MNNYREELPRREKEIVHLLIEGYSNKEIARHLNISVNTTEFHLKNIFQKLDVSSRTEAVVKAVMIDPNILESDFN